MSPQMDFGQNLTLQHYTPLAGSPGAIQQTQFMAIISMMQLN